MNNYGQTAVPAVTGGWALLAAGYHHTCGVTKLKSKTLCWGGNYQGQTDVPTVALPSDVLRIGLRAWIAL